MITILLIYLIISSIVNSRSFLASFAELYIWLTSKSKWHSRIKKSFLKYIAKHHKENKPVKFISKKVDIKEIEQEEGETICE